MPKGKENQGSRTDLCQISDKSYEPVDTKKIIAEKAKVSQEKILFTTGRKFTTGKKIL